MKQTWYQKEQQRKKMQASQGAEHSLEHAHHEKARGQVREGFPSWLVELIDVLEAIWAALPASRSEPNHPVAQKLAQLKSDVGYKD